jgi:translation initiation factor 4E
MDNLGCFNTIEGFYSFYIYLVRPSSLPKDINLSLFRGTVPATWESYPSGGCYLIRLKKKSSAKLDLSWESLLFAAIGEAFDEADVVGVTVGIRSKEDIVSVWSSNILSSFFFLFFFSLGWGMMGDDGGID